MVPRLFIVAAAFVLGATASTAQTHGQLLESAIFAEDTAGDLNGAIRIYEQLASAPAVPREIASRARSRLAEARRQRDEAVRLMASAVDQGRTGQPGQIDPPPAAPRTPPTPPTGMWAGLYDANRPVSVTGSVTQIQWSNPMVVVYLKDAEGKLWGFTLAPPNVLTREGISRDSIKLGEQLMAQGFLAKGEGADCPAPLPSACATFPNGAVHATARQLLRSDGSSPTKPDASQPASTTGGRGGRGGRSGGAQ